MTGAEVFVLVFFLAPIYTIKFSWAHSVPCSILFVWGIVVAFKKKEKSARYLVLSALFVAWIIYSFLCSALYIVA